MTNKEKILSYTCFKDITMTSKYGMDGSGDRTGP